MFESANLEILPQLLVNALISGSIYALASSGLSLTYGLLRILNFAHGNFMMLGAYCFYFFMVMSAYDIMLASIFTFALAILFSLICLHIFVLPFISLNFLLCLVTTLALANIIEASVSIYFGVNVKSFPNNAFSASVQMGGIYITKIQILIVSSALILLSFLATLIHFTSIGRKIRALSEQPYAAEAIGISKRNVTYFLFSLGTILAAYAGILVAFETNMQPTMGNSYTIKAFAAMVLGGLGNLWGTIVGSYILGLLENLSVGLEFGAYSIPASYRDAFSFIIILGVLLFKPQGLFVSKARKI